MLEYVTHDDVIVCVGQTAKENDILTQSSNPKYWWMHASGYPGAHVVLQYDGDEVPREMKRDAPRSHTQLLMPMIESVLSEVGLKANQLDAIGVAIGPGSFTGLRIGFATTQGLAFGLDIPVIPVSSLQVMVATYMRKTAHAQCPSKPGQTLRVMPILDARMGEFNCGCYIIDHNVA